MAQRVPRLPRRRARATSRFEHYSDGFDFDTQIILELHRRREAHRRGADPDLLRRRDLLRQRPQVRQGRRRATSSRYRLRAMGFGAARRRRRRAATSSSRGDAARTVGCSSWLAASRPTGSSTSGAPTAASARSSARSGHQVDGVDLVKHEGVGERARTASSRPTSTTDCPPRSATAIDFVVAADVLEHVVDPARAARPMSRAARSGRGDPRQRAELRPLVPSRPGRRSAASTTTSAVRSTRATCASSRRASFERLVAECGLEIRERDVVGVPFGILDRGGPATVATRALGYASAGDQAAARIWPTMFGYQLLYRLVRRP